MITFNEWQNSIIEKSKGLFTDNCAMDSDSWAEKVLQGEAFIGYSTNRDANEVRNSNYDTFLKSATLEHEDQWKTERFNHWACGWINYIFVLKDSLYANVCFDLHEKIDLYPVLDYEDLSKREWENVQCMVRDHASSIFLHSDATDQKEIEAYLSEHIEDYSAYGDGADYVSYWHTNKGLEQDIGITINEDAPKWVRELLD